MKDTRTNSDRTLVAPLVAGLCILGYAALLFFIVRSFRDAIAEMAEQETRVTIVNADGSVFFDTEDASGSHASREEVQRAFAEGRGTVLRHSATLDRDLLYCARRVGARVVRLAVPYTGVIKSERRFWAGIALAGVGGACIIALVFLMARRTSRRIDEQARQLAIAMASESFRREFTSNVTHELKSPLTAILGAIEMLGDGSGLSDGERKDLFDIIHRESERLGSLVGDVLLLAQIEREEAFGTTNFIPLRLDDLLATVVLDEQIKAQARHIRIALVRNDVATVRGDAKRLEEVLTNLIANAVRYSGSDHIEIASVAGPTTVRVTVTDFGIGIAAEHLPHLFERFYRVNKSRSRALGGTGLGLAIVKHLVQLHGGTVAVSSTPGLRTDFSFTLPVVRDA
ncbi:MAG: sensor histidine kinase [Kiritimatiellia bacterium]